MNTHIVYTHLCNATCHFILYILYSMWTLKCGVAVGHDFSNHLQTETHLTLKSIPQPTLSADSADPEHM